MSKTIQHKRSSVAGNKPDNSQIAVGEIAINFPDRLLFTKDASGNIVELEKDIWRRATEPDSAREGDLWYNTSTKEIYFYNGDSFQDIGITSDAAATVDPSNTTSTPAFSSGTGTSGDPFVLSSVNATAGDTNVILGTITVSNLDSNQSVPGQDLNSATNGSRFSFTNTTADASGSLTTNISFTDTPTSTSPQTFSGEMKLGSASIYINGDVILSVPLEGGTSTNNPNGTGSSTNTWNGSNGSTLTTSGDLLLSTDGVTFSSSVSVNNGDTFYIKWAGDPGSGTGIDGAHGTTITGTITDDKGGAESFTLTIDKETTFEFQTGVDSDAALSSTSTSSSTTISGINSYIYPFGSSTGTTPEYSKNSGSYLGIPASNSGDATHYVENGDTVDLRHVNSASNNTESVTTLNMANHSATYTTVTVDVDPVVATPSITAPATDGETGIGVSGPFTSSAFAMAAGSDTHTASSWEVSSAAWTLNDLQTAVGSFVMPGLTYGGGQYVAVGLQGLVATSSDGITWTSNENLKNATSSTTMKAVVYNPDHQNGARYFAMGSLAKGGWSTNGTTWTQINLGTMHGTGEYKDAVVVGGETIFIGQYASLTVEDGTGSFTPKSALNSAVGSVFLQSIAYSGSTYVVVGQNSACATATTYDTWTNQPNLAAVTGGVYMLGVEWSDDLGLFCAVGESGACATSPDGVTWTNQTGLATAVASSQMNNIIWDGSQFMAGGESGKIATSPDGVTWSLDGSLTAAGFTKDIFGIATDGTESAVTGGTGYGAYYASSTVEQSLNDTSNLTSWSPSSALAYETGFKVKVKHHTATLNSEYSDERSFTTAGAPGSQWTDHTSSLAGVLGGTSTAQSVAWSGTQFIAVGNGGGLTMAASSPDGVTWQQEPGFRTAFGDLVPTSIVWSPDLSMFCAVGRTGTCVTSSDGISWTTQSNYQTISQSTNMTVVIWDPDGSQFVSMGNSGMCVTSPDGVTWTRRTGINQSIEDVSWSGTVFAAVGSSGSCFTSPDGVTWTNQTSAITAAMGHSLTIYNIDWNGSYFLAGGASGSMATSPDGVTWTAVSGNLSSVWTANASVILWMDTQWVAAGGSSELITSSDGVTWTDQPALAAITTDLSRDIVWTGSQLLAVGNNAACASSS